MEGEKWHPSHDLEAVTALYKQKAIEAVGQYRFDRIEVIMIDDDHGNKEPELNLFN